jgi:hypothetical protein
MAAFHFITDRHCPPVCVDLHAMHARAGPHRQVRSVAPLAYERHVRAPAGLPFVVHPLVSDDAREVAVVEVFLGAEARLDRRAHARFGEGGRRTPVRAQHALDGLEVGDHVPPAPARRPLFVVEGGAPRVDHGIDGAASAEPRSRSEEQALVARAALRRREALPDEAVVGEGVFVAVGAQRLRMALGCVAAFEEQHPHRRILSELTGRDATRGAAADDHIVERAHGARPRAARASERSAEILARTPGR